MTIIISSVSISYKNFSLSEKISIEIRGEVDNPGIIEIDRGSVYQDIVEHIVFKEEADRDFIALNKPLYHNEIISVPKKQSSKISINNADIDELIKLPSIGVKTAEKIIAYRNENGGFKQIEEIQNVSGIKAKTFEKLKDYITV